MASRKRGAEQDEKEKWARFTKEMKNKRTKNIKKPSKDVNVDSSVGSNILKQGEMVVQQLESEPSGKAKKYERISAQEFVKFEYDEVTLPNIKEACQVHFSGKLPAGMTCDVLASERGPSCSKVSHLSNFKVIHVRFIKKEESTMEKSHCDRITSDRLSNIFQDSPFPCHNICPPPPPPPHHSLFTTTASTSKINFNATLTPKSISVSTMLKLGNVISKVDNLGYEKVEVMNFTIRKDGSSWAAPSIVEMKIEKLPFASGGFREVFRANSKDGKTYVLKRFLPSSLRTIKELNETMETTESAETFARRTIQTHMLAKNFADQLRANLSSDNRVEFGETFVYCEAMLGMIVRNGEFVMLEDHIPGNFSKFINNNGEIIYDENKKELIAKDECLCHYSFVKSEGELLLVDIQGCDYFLFDPEIASVKGLIGNNGFQFSLGNLSNVALKNFKTLHKCNKSCKMVGLTEIEN